MRVVAPQGLIAERYRLLQPLGSGASATMWAAQDETLGRRVALKLLSGQAAEDEDERNQLRREARALAALKHPHIIVVFDFLEAPGLDGAVQPVLVTELLEGHSLAARLAEGPLPWPDALSVCGELADALAAAHRAGIVHRDVTPANVMLTDSGVKLLDFGIAKATAEDGTVNGLTVGTPVCMAPEQLTGQAALPASDMYALGCVLYWCLTGRPPFRDRDITWLSHAHMHAAPPQLAIPGLPQGINEFYLACLAKTPDHRPTAEQAAETLMPYTSAPAPVADQPPPDDTTQMLPVFPATDADSAANTDSATDTVVGPRPFRSVTRRHAGGGAAIDRRRLLPVGLLVAALAVIALLMLGLAHTISGGGSSTAQSTGTASAGTPATNAASATATVGSVILPSGSAIPSASPSSSPSATPSRTPAALAVPALPDPAGNPIGYLQALAGQVQALIAQGPATLDANAGQDLRNSLGDLANAVDSAQQNGGRKQWRNVAGSIAGVQQQISGDASAGRISAPAANLLSGELQRLAGSLPANGG